MEEAEKTTEEQIVNSESCLKQKSRGKIVQSRKERGETHRLRPSSSQCLPMAEPSQKPPDLGNRAEWVGEGQGINLRQTGPGGQGILGTPVLWGSLTILFCFIWKISAVFVHVIC